MRSIKFFVSFCVLLSATASAQWIKIKDADYVWGPFKIYNISLFSETGKYELDTRPVMLSLKYQKPVDGRDFAISLARSWSNLGITLPNQDDVVDRLRKILPDIKVGDTLSYVALENKGYFVLNDTVIAEEFNQDFNNAVVAVWLDPRVEIGRKLLSQNIKQDGNTNDVINPVSPIPEALLEQEQKSQHATVETSDVSEVIKGNVIDKTQPSGNPVENTVTTPQKVSEQKVTSEQKQVDAEVTAVETKTEETVVQSKTDQEQTTTETSKVEQPSKVETKLEQNKPVPEKKPEPESQKKDDDEIQISPPVDPVLIPKPPLS
ncbi:pyruvate formate lyase-activating protein [Ursidibacter maritimus]|uniref:Pyruvate formate lyase-activating protein n=1 Tax=Ursidibacter maritimus TaxID=1331689 RepID=A0A949WED4_9PAST|nr:pyruvate formate lyase-activating protein [Ursidibacter maritimus]MBV6524711.1 pyruvate formate lyase-activating protein [Ursidibacter maritimus]MBV6525019.1 pyruvate formate lyase-activating protein [Ursidibacter maritimus]MBV6527221.1 pyruvate formate lyase-activating protein [Ursidibacter maritimus]MBV6530185.1 pyruvate formate lyase-activating protein [Ursidibacter maritimus]MBV6530744.1 pyruvate formate lyase-activating protein [Ursidibacter maritimus]